MNYKIVKFFTEVYEGYLETHAEVKAKTLLKKDLDDLYQTDDLSKRDYEKLLMIFDIETIPVKTKYNTEPCSGLGRVIGRCV